MTPDLFARVVDCDATTARKWAPAIEAAMFEFGIMSRERVAMFLAQTGHESSGFTQFVENFNYSTTSLLKKFGRHRITEGQARLYGRNELHPANPEMLANILYGGEWGREHLGNTEPGHGWLYRGQGCIQITGLANVTRCRNRLRVRLGTRVPDFVAEPHLLCTPEWGAYSAGDFWHANGLAKFADAGDVEGCTRVVNGGLNGLDDRATRYDDAMRVLR